MITKILKPILLLSILFAFNTAVLDAQDSKCEKCEIEEKTESSKSDKDPCKVQNFMMDEVSLSDFTDKSFLSYVLTISFKDKKVQPKSMVVLMTITNCKNEKQTIKTELKLDEKTNTWVGKQNMMQNKDCPWKITSYSVLAYNECSDEYSTDEIEIDLLKAAGKLPARDRIIERRRRG